MGNTSSAAVQTSIEPILAHLGKLTLETKETDELRDTLIQLLKQNPAGLYSAQDKLIEMHAQLPPWAMPYLLQYGLDLRNPKTSTTFFNHASNIKFTVDPSVTDTKEKQRKRLELEQKSNELMTQFIRTYVAAGMDIPPSIYSPMDTNKTSFGQQAQSYTYPFESYCLLDLYSDYYLPTNNVANSVLSYLYTLSTKVPEANFHDVLFPSSMQKNFCFQIVCKPSHAVVDLKVHRRYLASFKNSSIIAISTLGELIENHPAVDTISWKDIDQKMGSNGLVWELLINSPVTDSDLLVIFTGKLKTLIHQITTGVRIHTLCGKLNMYPVMLAILRHVSPTSLRFFLTSKDPSYINHQDECGRTILMYLFGCQYGSYIEQEYVEFMHFVLDLPHLDVDLLDHNDQNVVFYLFQSRATVHTHDYLNKIIARSKNVPALFHTINQNGHGNKAFYYYDKVNANLRNRPPTTLTSHLILKDYGSITRTLFDIFPNRAFQIYRWLLSKIKIDLADHELMRIIFNHIMILDPKVGGAQQFHIDCYKHNHQDSSHNLAKSEPFPPPLTEMSPSSPSSASSSGGSGDREESSRESDGPKDSIRDYSTGSFYFQHGSSQSTPELTCYQIHDCLRRLVNVTMAQVTHPGRRNRSLHQMIYAAINRSCHPTIFDTLVTSIGNAIHVIQWHQLPKMERYIGPLMDSTPYEYLDRWYSYGFDVNYYDSRPFHLLYYRDDADSERLTGLMARGGRVYLENTNTSEAQTLKAHRIREIRKASTTVPPYNVYAGTMFYTRFGLPVDNKRHWGQQLGNLPDRYKVLVFAYYMIHLGKPITLTIDHILSTEDTYEFNQFVTSTQFKDLFTTMLPSYPTLTKIMKFIPTLDLKKLNTCHKHGLFGLGLQEVMLTAEDIQLLSTQGLMDGNDIISTVSYHKENAFMLAIIRQYHQTSLQTIAKSVKDVNFVDSRNRSALMYMLATGLYVRCPTFFNEYITSTASTLDYALYDKKRLSYLHYALKYKAPMHVVELLLEKSQKDKSVAVSFFARTRKDKTVVDYAEANGYSRELIDKLAALVDTHGNGSSTAAAASTPASTPATPAAVPTTTTTTEAVATESDVASPSDDITATTTTTDLDNDTATPSENDDVDDNQQPSESIESTPSGSE